MENMKPAIILLVEDDPGDQKLITVSLRNQKLGNEVHIASSGEEAMEFLYQRGKYSDGAPQPDLILLDLNMPGDTYNLHASGYIKKPVKLEDFKRVVKAINEYWFVLCRLPPREG